MRDTMKDNVLLKDGQKYTGQYVATQSFTCQNVVSYGTDVKVVQKEAQDKGYKNPVVFYVPEKGMAHIY
jgi:hypothetical protein